ncbi:MAG TPA: hypothetical protein PK024_09740 [Methanospirillum sp.]|uniref:hypothetical protein n=1 Tax=Methanospirillum sp. TaxID=45200 RepID=UPI002C322BC4|nr:hypothetical protein [Methanospirillum sp.]HOJ97100.1 hypothetical protein [Methanospirillum sp.]HPP78914.1 hypothetical protein [Methanospirillum sp.]
MNPFSDYQFPDLMTIHENFIINSIMGNDSDEECLPCMKNYEMIHASTQMIETRTEDDFRREIRNFGLRLVPYGSSDRVYQVKMPMISNTYDDSRKIKPEPYTYYNDPEGNLPDDMPTEPVIYVE